MSTLQENLAQWARFEPAYCRECHSVQSVWVGDRFCLIAEEPTETDLALLLNCLLLAVVRHNLRVRLENSLNGEEWHVDLRHADDHQWGCSSIGTIDEAAQTLLAAYVRWLQEKKTREAICAAT